MDNYEKAKKQAQEYFLTLDQGEFLKSCPFSYDESYIYVEFLGCPYGLCRKTGRIENRREKREAGFEETLSIFDFLCHRGENKRLKGVWAPVDSLKGRPKALASLGGFYDELSKGFDRNQAAFRRACEELGAEAVSMGDIGYKFSVFPDFPVILKFYASDEDFPAQTVLLWDENTLSYLYYETTFYIAGHLLRKITAQMCP